MSRREAAKLSIVTPRHELNESRRARRTVSTRQHSSVAVFICCSDSRKDILARVLPSILNFWPDCPYPIYVGVNSARGISPGVTPLTAEQGGWRKECSAQVAQIRATHLIVILDDFLFQGPVDQAKVSQLVHEAIASDISYLRLIPLGKSLFERISKKNGENTAGAINQIHEKRPFYSCLQIALWEKKHFEAMLKLDGSIWDFEHQRLIDVPHFTITDRSPFKYRHLIEKGRWLPNAKSLLHNAGLPTDLGYRPRWTMLRSLHLLVDHLKLIVLGYANH